MAGASRSDAGYRCPERLLVNNWPTKNLTTRTTWTKNGRLHHSTFSSFRLFSAVPQRDPKNAVSLQATRSARKRDFSGVRALRGQQIQTDLFEVFRAAERCERQTSQSSLCCLFTFCSGRAEALRKSSKAKGRSHAGSHRVKLTRPSALASIFSSALHVLSSATHVNCVPISNTCFFFRAEASYPQTSQLSNVLRARWLVLSHKITHDSCLRAPCVALAVTSFQTT